MYFRNLKALMPLIVYPCDVALKGFELELMRMLSLRGKVPSLSELDAFIEILVEFHKSIDALKYGIFDQTDQDKEICLKITEDAVGIGIAPKTALAEMVKITNAADLAIVKEVKKALDLKIKKAQVLIQSAKDLKKFFESR